MSIKTRETNARMMSITGNNTIKAAMTIARKSPFSSGVSWMFFLACSLRLATSAFDS